MSWIPLPRTVMQSPVFKDPRTLKVWLWCCLKTSHRATVFNMQLPNSTEAVHLAEGDFIFSRQKGANEVDMPVTTFGRELKKLEAMGHIKVIPHRYYSIISVLIKFSKPKPTAKPNAIKNARPITTQTLTDAEVSKAITVLQKECLPQLMSDLYIYSHPDIICTGYQSYLQKKPQQFSSIHDVQQHIQQYLLSEWV